MAKRFCPKCGAEMYATGGGYNYKCTICTYSDHETRPRPHISSGVSDSMQEATDELHQILAESARREREWKAASLEEERLRKKQREAEKVQRKREVEQRKVEKLQSKAAKLQGRADKLQNRAAAQQRKAQQKQEKKGISLGTVIGVIIVLWILAQFFA